MRALIVCVSVSHGNTRRVAEAMGEVIGAAVVEPGGMRPGDVTGYDLLGFGSGIYGMNFHPRLWRFVAGLPAGHGTPVFLFATSGAGSFVWRPAAILLGRLLAARGYRVVDTFSCRGFDTWLPLRLVGGINKGRPGPSDLAAAGRFAEQLRRRVLPPSGAAPGSDPGSRSRSRPGPRARPRPRSEPDRLRAVRQGRTGSTGKPTSVTRGPHPAAN